MGFPHFPTFPHFIPRFFNILINSNNFSRTVGIQWGWAEGIGVIGEILETGSTPPWVEAQPSRGVAKRA